MTPKMTPDMTPDVPPDSTGQKPGRKAERLPPLADIEPDPVDDGALIVLIAASALGTVLTVVTLFLGFGPLAAICVLVLPLLLAIRITIRGAKARDLSGRSASPGDPARQDRTRSQPEWQPW